jgi:RNA polymerase sigma-70 factor, ECF subfamily
MDRTEDTELLRRLRQGDQTALADLEDKYGARIFQLALRHMRNREDAEEVAQDVLYKVYRKIGAFRGDSALSSWIYRITFNSAMSRLRTARLARLAAEERTRLEASEDGQQRHGASRHPVDWSRLPDEALLRAELRADASRAIAELPEIYRAPIVLRDLRGLSTAEASAELQVKDQTLKSRLHRGRLMLRERLHSYEDGLRLHSEAIAA